MARTMVAMSGGVDSSVSALLLKRARRDIAGMFMKNWEEDDPTGVCPAEADAADARAVAKMLGIPFYARNFAAEYWEGVFEHFIAEYRANRTPNPDILCNSEIKFKTFVEHAQDLGSERIATGHYAALRFTGGAWQLLRGADADKDQSYFLHLLSQEQLALTEFPLGELRKAQVRQLAEEAQLPVAKKKDSTGICFVGERNFEAFLAQYVETNPGPIIDLSGEEIGRHRGLSFYTLGQRQGLGIGGVAGAPEEPWFVCHKDVEHNQLVVVQGHDHSALLSQKLSTLEAHWIAGDPPTQSFTCAAKIRYRQPDQHCQVRVASDGRLEVEFDEPQRAATPGQSIVFYDDRVCLGGAVIEATDQPVPKIARARRVTHA